MQKEEGGKRGERGREEYYGNRVEGEHYFPSPYYSSSYLPPFYNPYYYHPLSPSFPYSYPSPYYYPPLSSHLSLPQPLPQHPPPPQQLPHNVLQHPPQHPPQHPAPLGGPFLPQPPPLDESDNRQYYPYPYPPHQPNPTPPLGQQLAQIHRPGGGWNGERGNGEGGGKGPILRPVQGLSSPPFFSHPPLPLSSPSLPPPRRLYPQQQSNKPLPLPLSPFRSSLAPSSRGKRRGTEGGEGVRGRRALTPERRKTVPHPPLPSSFPLSSLTPPSPPLPLPLHPPSNLPPSHSHFQAPKQGEQKKKEEREEDYEGHLPSSPSYHLPSSIHGHLTPVHYVPIPPPHVLLPQLSDLGTPALPQTIKEEINLFQLEGYAAHFFRQKKHGVFRKKIPVQELLQWTDEPLKGSLLVHTKKHEMDKHAVACFKKVQCYMGDKDGSGRSKDEIGQRILRMGVNVGEMRDEIYIQLCKQVTNNPNPKSNYLGWELIVIVTASFPPSKNLEGHLHKFFEEYWKHREKQIRKMARYSSKSLHQICSRKGSMSVLSKAEIQQAREMPFTKSFFGVTLETIMENQAKSHPKLTIPIIQCALVDQLRKKKACEVEGIFRISAGSGKVAEYKAAADHGDFSFPDADPHELACLLKLWLKQLEQPVIPGHLYTQCLSNYGSKENVGKVLNEMTGVHRTVLTHLVLFLQTICDKSNVAKSKMSAANLGIVFSPLLMLCPYDDPLMILENTAYESKFIETLLRTDMRPFFNNL